MNREALKLARQIADKTGIDLQSVTNWVHGTLLFYSYLDFIMILGALMAGNICNTTVWKPDDPEIDKKVHDIFKVHVHSSNITNPAY